jgi:hypothetical protein
MMTKTIEETIEAMELLVEKQDKTLKVANEIIAMKNRMIELCELQIEMQKKQNRIQLVIIVVLSAISAISGVLLIATA